MTNFKTSRLFAYGLLLTAGFFAALPAHAQVRPQGELSFIVGLPQGEFNEHVDQAGFGGSLFGGIGLGASPVTLGLDLAFMVYGYERRSEPFSNTIPDVTVDVTTSNNIGMGHLVLRLEPPSGAIRPYLDGLVGLKYLYTETNIENEGFGDNESIARSVNFDDTALSYGVGGGLNVRVYSGQLGEDTPHGIILVNLGARYLFGGEAEYLQKGSIRRENGEVTFDVDRSRTDLLIPQLGVSFVF